MTDMVCQVRECPGFGTPHPPNTFTFTTEQVAWEQSIPVGQLLDSSGYRPEAIDRWTLEDVALDDLHGRYEPDGYLEDEPEYMVRLAYAIAAGEVPPPAFVLDERGYVHADGAHRTIVAMLRGESTIRAYVAHLR